MRNTKQKYILYFIHKSINTVKCKLSTCMQGLDHILKRLQRHKIKDQLFLYYWYLTSEGHCGLGESFKYKLYAHKREIFELFL